MAALLLLVTTIAYFPALHGGFIWDDDSLLTKNHLITASDGLHRLWFTREPADYWPVTATSFWIEWRLWGMQAAGYHATNLALHLAESLLLWTILRRLRTPGSYLAALLFAVHPVNVESVAWIAQRKNLMSMLFYLLALLGFIEAVPWAGATPRRGREKWLWFSLIAFALGMLSKGSVAILPLVLLGLIAWHRRLGMRDVLRTLPFFAVAAFFAAVDIWFQRHGSGEVIRSASALARLLGAGAAIWFYLHKALIPLKLTFIYPQWGIRPSEAEWWLPLGGALAVTVFLWRSSTAARSAAHGRNWARPAFFAWGYFCAALLPVMGLTDVQFMKFSLVADHYQHIAIIGVVVLLAAGWGTWVQTCPPLRRPFPVAVAATVVMVLASMTWRQGRMYHDPETLYLTTIERNPDGWMAHNNLGNVYFHAGRTAEAIAQYAEAVRLNPEFTEAHKSLGNALLRADRVPEAIRQFEAALKSNPDDADAQNNLAAALARNRRLPEAIAHYRQALRLRPGSAETHYGLGIVLVQAGQPGEAVVEYEEALRLKPTDAETHANLGAVFAASGRLPEAIHQLEQALQLSPDDTEARANLGLALSAAGRKEEAIAQYEQVLQREPTLPGIQSSLGNALAEKGRLPEAIAHYEEALRLRPDDAEVHYNLGLALRALDRPAEAKIQFQAARRLNPDLPDGNVP